MATIPPLYLIVSGWCYLLFMISEYVLSIVGFDSCCGSIFLFCLVCIALPIVMYRTLCL